MFLFPLVASLAPSTNYNRQSATKRLQPERNLAGILMRTAMISVPEIIKLKARWPLKRPTPVNPLTLAVDPGLD